MKKLNKKGFSLVELIIVIAVIAILAAVLIPTFSNMIKKANESAVLQAGRSAYESMLTIDLADGTLDKLEGTTPIVLATGTADGVYEVTVNGKSTDYSLFKYRDSSKKLQAVYDGKEWKVTVYPEQ